MNTDKEYIELLIKNSIEDKTQSIRSQSFKKMNILFAIAVITMLLLIVGAKYIVSNSIEKKLNTTLTQRFDERELKHFSILEHKLLYISIINDLTATYNNNPIEAEVDNLINKIYKLKLNYHGEKGNTVEQLVFKLSSLLSANKHTTHLLEISELFKDIISHSTRINNIFVNYYGSKVLNSTINIHDHHFTQYYNAFNQHVEYSKDLDSEKEILPILMLVNFQISGQMRSQNINKLIHYLNSLSTDDKAYFLVDFTINIAQGYNNHIDYYSINQIIQEFMRIYKNELEQLMYNDGVKESILQRYKLSHSDKEIAKYKLALNTLYNFGL